MVANNWVTTASNTPVIQIRRSCFFLCNILGINRTASIFSF